MTGVEARTIMEAAVRRELFGPPADEPARGKPVDCSSGTTHFDRREDSYGMWHEAATGQEVLTTSDPLRRYGIGILFSGATHRGSAIGEPTKDEDGGTDEIGGTTGLSTTDEDMSEPAIEVEVKGTTAPRGEADSDDFDLTDANSFKPSAMALSLQCDVVSGGSFRATGRIRWRLALDRQCGKTDAVRGRDRERLIECDLVAFDAAVMFEQRNER